MEGSPPDERVPGSVVSDPPFELPPLRAVAGILVILVVLGGVVYPLALFGFVRSTGGFDANGNFVPGGDPSALATTLIGQNITNASLFWLRPSLTDYNATVGSGETPYGPTDPALTNLTLYYLGAYGLNNTTAPLALVSNSYSGFDPDLLVPSALVQVPRIASHTNLTEAFLTKFVQDHETMPYLGFIGPTYVNVIALDTDLIAWIASPGR